MGIATYLLSQSLWRLPSSIAGYEPVIATSAVLLVAFAIYQALFAASRVCYPDNLPLFGEPVGARRFSWRTRWRYYTDCGAMYTEAYEKYTKHNRPVLLPGLGSRRDLVLPQDAMRWVLSRPENELSHADAILEVVQLRYSLGSDKYKVDMWPGLLVKTGLNAILETVAADVDDELQCALDACIGADTDSWREVNVLQTSRRVMGQVAARFVVGLPFARNDAFLADLWTVMDGIVLVGGVAGALPQAMRPVLGPLVAWNLRRSIGRMKKHLAPLILERLQDLDRREGVAAGAGESKSSSNKMPRKAANDDDDDDHHDLLQMMLRFARSQRPDELHDLDTLTRRVCFAFFGAVHQTTLLVHNVLLNIIDSDAEFGTIAALRAENEALGAADKQWTKSRVARMVKCDSVARETLRLHSYTNRGLFRKVLVDGLVVPCNDAGGHNQGGDGGLALPRNAQISFLGRPLQRDTQQYPDPHKYDPFRFSRLRNGAATAMKEEDQVVGGGDRSGGDTRPGLSFVSTSPIHLVFGHGNHSCPGRFLVDFEVKMVVAHVLERYDIEFPEEYGGRRPQGRWLTEAFAPPEHASIRFRRRKAAA